jgi:fumarylacetoacetate (FAA) hydrolase
MAESTRYLLQTCTRSFASAQDEAARPRIDKSFAVDEVRFHAPLKPTTLRDAYAFEQHVRPPAKTADVMCRRNGINSLFSITQIQIVSLGQVTKSHIRITLNAMDFELEIAVIIGKPGINIKPEDAPNHIFGYTIFNDWSARDVQRAEMKAGLGPAKGKDFASSLGPVIVTSEALADRSVNRPGVYDLNMVARVNGVEISKANFKDIYWSFGEIIARASDTCELQAGDVIGSGTVGTGCLLELTKAEGPWLNAGDLVELEIERIGILKNIIGGKQSMNKKFLGLAGFYFLHWHVDWRSPATSVPAEQGVETIVAATFSALTASAPPVAEATQESEQLTPDGTPVNTAEISFLIPNGIANDATSVTNTEVEYPFVNPSNGAMPQHVKLTLNLYALNGTQLEPHIMIFRAAEYAQYTENTASIINEMQSLQYVDGQPLSEKLGSDFISTDPRGQFQEWTWRSLSDAGLHELSSREQYGIALLLSRHNRRWQVLCSSYSAHQRAFPCSRW